MRTCECEVMPSLSCGGTTRDGNWAGPAEVILDKPDGSRPAGWWRRHECTQLRTAKPGPVSRIVHFNHNLWKKINISVTRVYVPRFFVSSQQRFGATDIKALGASQLSGLWTNRATALRQISVTAPFYLEDSRRIQDSKRREWRSAWGGMRGKERERERARARGRESPRESALAPPFICFFLHLGLPYANWA